MCAQPMLHAVDVASDASPDRSPRLLLVSPSALEREGLSLVLQRGDFDVYAVATESEAIKAASVPSPDLIVIDVPGLPSCVDGGKILELHQVFPNLPLILLSERLNPVWLRACQDANLAGYLTKSSSGPAIYRQLRLILQGERIVPMKILSEIAIAAGEADHSLEQKRVQALTKRDIDVLSLLVAGHSNKMIAERLKIAESTVKVVMKAVFAKIHVTNRTQAALWALNNGIQSHLTVTEREPTFT